MFNADSANCHTDMKKVTHSLPDAASSKYFNGYHALFVKQGQWNVYSQNIKHFIFDYLTFSKTKLLK